jgi:hypothetical protein
MVTGLQRLAAKGAGQTVVMEGKTRTEVIHRNHTVAVRCVKRIGPQHEQQSRDSVTGYNYTLTAVFWAS